jgi:hypothetical protein
MTPNKLRFPVKCPICASESLIEFPADPMRNALKNRYKLLFYAGCHEDPWIATAVEVHQIREYLAATSASAGTTGPWG